MEEVMTRSRHRNRARLSVVMKAHPHTQEGKLTTCMNMRRLFRAHLGGTEKARPHTEEGKLMTCVEHRYRARLSVLRTSQVQRRRKAAAEWVGRRRKSAACVALWRMRLKVAGATRFSSASHVA
jgi:hypothetical protein